MIEAVQSFVTFLADSRHRVMVTTTSMIVFWLFAAWSLGMLSAFGAGFARAEDVKSVQSTLLEQGIIEARTRYCQAPNGTPMKNYFLKAVNDKLVEYKELTGLQYPLPQCEELVLASN